MIASTELALRERNAELEAKLAAGQSALDALLRERDQLIEERDRTIERVTAERDRVASERDHLRAAHERLRLELELLKRRIFVAKAERVDSAQLELEFAHKLLELDRLGGLPLQDDTEAHGGAAKTKPRPTGRRDLRKAPIAEEERIEISDPVFEKLVAEGKAERFDFEESCKLGWKRGGMRRLIIARVKYRTVDDAGQSHIETTPMPPEAFSRSLAAPSMLAHVIVEKYCDGLPLHRIEDRFLRDGFPVDRGTMCRWVEDAGATLGATVVDAMRAEAMRTAFCIATDATGVSVQPVRSHDKQRQACRRGHYFVQLADKDHVFFEYTPRETSDAVGQMFRGFSGYIQADAKSVYDALFREPGGEPPEGDESLVRREVGCWAHARRKFWEATVAKDPVAREGLARIGRIFALDEGFQGKSPAERNRLRNAHMKPHLEAFFAWAEVQYDVVRDQRGLLRSALGYAVRQQDALLRVLDDGRLPLDNNRSERALRAIAVGRKAWLFVGSDDHAQSAAHLFSLIASARLHTLDPEAYLRDLLRVLAHWPRERYLELAPKYWAQTKARLDAAQLARDVGPLSIPDP